MARYEHLPIYRAAFDLAVHMEKTVKSFSRYHKYTLGTELRNQSRLILSRIIEANSSRERLPLLCKLRDDVEWFKVLARLCQESGGFACTRSYLHVAELAVGIAKQNEGWIRTSRGVKRKGRAEANEANFEADVLFEENGSSGEAGQGQN
jgi:hypothetical protein